MRAETRTIEMAKVKKATEAVETPEQTVTIPKGANPELLEALKALGLVFTQAIKDSKGPEKKNAANRKPVTPWTPKNGEAKLKLKRKWYQHSIPVDPELLTNDQIALFNKVKPGRFLDNWVLVERRKDGGMNFTYPVKTPSQRMKLANQFGIAGPKALDILLQRLIDEAANPKPFVPEVEDED